MTYFNMKEKYPSQLRMSIVHCSSEDDTFPVTELACRTAYTGGWHSAKMPEYPQELGFRFEGIVDLQQLRLLCHESKIPSRVEVFISEATEEDRKLEKFPTYSSAVFRRLGHVNFGTNTENNFAARELKTINIRHKCIYLKLILRKNHTNKINIFNQVGLIALSTHGTLLTSSLRPQFDTTHDIIMAGDDEVPMEEIFLSRGVRHLANYKNQQGGACDSNDDAYYKKESMKYNTIGNSNKNRDNGGSQGDSDQIATDDELDATTGGKIRELTLYKARAVAEEDYDLAEALKEQVALLKELGAQIAILEKRKLIAVNEEDYSAAKAFKIQIDELRARGDNRAYGKKSFEQNHCSKHHKAPESFKSSPAMANPIVNQSLDGLQNKVGSSGNDNVAIRCVGSSKTDQEKTGGIILQTTSAMMAPKGPVAQIITADMSPWMITVNKACMALLIGDDRTPAELLSTKKESEYGHFSSFFGHYITCCLFSKRWQLREAAIRTIGINTSSYQTLVNDSPNGSQVILQLMNYFTIKGYGVTDSVANVFSCTCEALKEIYCGSCPTAALVNPKPPSVAHLSGPLSLVLPELMMKVGDSNHRVRENSLELLLAMARSPVGPEKIAAVCLAEPASAFGSKKPLNFRLGLGRISLITSLLECVDLGTNDTNTCLTVDGLMQKVCLPCLQHSHQDVREAAQHLFALINRKSGPTYAAAMMNFMSSVKPAQRQIIAELIASNETPTASISSPVRSSAKDSKDANELFSTSVTVGKKQAGATSHSKLEMNGGTVHSRKSIESSILKTDPMKVCFFCHKYDPNFTEDLMDMHYINDCPMLCPCPFCQQIQEVSCLQHHLLRDCENKHLVGECPMCLEAILVEDLKAHIDANSCIKVNLKEFSLCPLCHEKLPPGHNGWEKHLAHLPGCFSNPRLLVKNDE